MHRNFSELKSGGTIPMLSPRPEKWGGRVPPPVPHRSTPVCSTDVKLTLLRTFCSPMYTAQLWWNYTVASIHKLHVAYNNVFRLLLNQPKYCSASTMFVEYHVPDSKTVIRNLVYKFMRRLDASYNKLVIAIINSDIKWQSRIRRHWIKMLYIHNSF